LGGRDLLTENRITRQLPAGRSGLSSHGVFKKNSFFIQNTREGDVAPSAARKRDANFSVDAFVHYSRRSEIDMTRGFRGHSVGVTNFAGRVIE
jgi:hypothetical protein